MPKPAFLDENAKISAAALRLTDAQGWPALTLDKIAKAAKIPPARLKQRFKATHELAPIIAAEIDREAFAAGDFSGNAHDVLFDLLMARFDVMQKHRAAIICMSHAARHDRALSYALMQATLDGIYRLIAAAKVTAPPRPVLALGLAGIYGWAFWQWRKDNSRDMAKTMAALDRALRVAGKAVELLQPAAK